MTESQKPPSNLSNWKNTMLAWIKTFFKKEPTPLISQTISSKSLEWQEINRLDQDSFIQRLIKVRDLKAEEFMTPRADIIAFNEAAKVDEISKIIQEFPHSFYPVFRESLDEVVGIVRVGELIPSLVEVSCRGHDFDLKPFVKEGVFIAPSLPLFDVIIKMKESPQHFLFVVDEYGGIDGIITLWDLLYELSTGIDETCAIGASPKIIKRQDGAYFLDARVELEELESCVGAFLTSEERKENIETLGGLLSFLAGHVPSRGQLISHKSGAQFEIIEADPRRVKWVVMILSH